MSTSRSTTRATPRPAPTTAATDGTSPTERSWRLAFGGDVLLTRTIASSADPFARIRPPLADADLAIINLETAITSRGTQQVKTYTFRSPRSFADRLVRAGVDVVSLANNHVLDYGTVGLADTVAALDEAGVAHTGAGANRAKAITPVSIAVRASDGSTVCVAVLAASQIIPSPTWVATDARPGIVSAGKHVLDDHTRGFLVAVQSAASTHDVTIAVMHWGLEGDPCPSRVQRRLARMLVNSGARAVLGAHPHVLQPVVTDTDPSGNAAAIAYSLGNFVWDPRSGSAADTGIVEMRFDGHDLVDTAFYPHQLDANGWAASVDPASAAGRRITQRARGRCPGADGRNG